MSSSKPTRNEPEGPKPWGFWNFFLLGAALGLIHSLWRTPGTCGCVTLILVAFLVLILIFWWKWILVAVAVTWLAVYAIRQFRRRQFKL